LGHVKTSVGQLGFRKWTHVQLCMSDNGTAEPGIKWWPSTPYELYLLRHHITVVHTIRLIS